jgi:outer membrane protein assembly factor BamB
VENSEEFGVRKKRSNTMKNKKGYSLMIILPMVLALLCSYCSTKKESEMAVQYEVPLGSENWPSFRGVNGAGLTGNQDLPLEWDIKSGKNIEWSYKTPGLGLSSPVIWEDRVFITTAIDQVEDRSTLKVGLLQSGVSVENENPHTWEVICLDRDTGKVIWRKEASRGVPKVKRHPKSSHANPTAATDGKHVVAFFGSEGLYCYDFEGKFIWKKDFGLLDSGSSIMPEAQWGFASSPIIHEGVVIIQVDVQQNSFIAALDIATGETIWKTDRDEIPTWSTPAIYVGEDRTQVVVNGYKHIGSYDFSTGTPIWWLKGGGDIPVPTPIFGFDHVYITSSHGRMRPIYAIKLSAEGDITPEDEDNLNQHISWYYERQGAYLPTPIIYGDYMYVCRNNGVIRCFDAKTGDEIYKQRVGGMQTAFGASPIAADGKLYLADELGDVHIVAAGPEYEYLGANEMEEYCLASPAISGNLLFVRTVGHLFAIGKGGKTKGIQMQVEEGKPGEKIDLTSVKTDGSISDLQELIKIVSAKLQTISSIEYDMDVKGVEASETTLGSYTFKTKMLGWILYGFPEYFYVEGDHKAVKEEASRLFAGGSDGSQFYFLDKTSNTIEKGIELDDMGDDFLLVEMGIIAEFVSDDPFSWEKTAEKKELRGKKEINGEECYELSFVFPQYDNFEKIWYISVQNFLPQALEIKYSQEDGKRGGYIQTLSKVTINQLTDPETFKIENIKDR